ncbi:MAG: hypothetical protein ACLFPM_06795 [Candidatus Izemoplasmatales bacterium]
MTELGEFPASVKVFENKLEDMNINSLGVEEYEWGRYAFGYSVDDIKQDDDFVYIENALSAEIIAIKNAEGKVTVPATYNSKPIIRIQSRSLLGYNGGVAFLDISEGVNYISTDAIRSSYIKYINIPLSVSAVNYRAFYTGNASIYVKVESKPDNWDSSWYYSADEIVWGEKIDLIISDDLYAYEVISGEAWITDYFGDWTYTTPLILPSSIEGYDVVGIRSDAIQYTSYQYSTPHEIVIPNTIEHIESNAINYYRYIILYSSFNSQPESWASNFWYGSSYNYESYRTYYWDGEWSYIDGVPEPTTQ